MIKDFHISELEEIQEIEEVYNIMNIRIKYCKNLMETDQPLGPGDICYIVKESTNKKFFGMGAKKVTKIGSYHYVYGIDTSNISFISAYISKFIQKQNQTNMKITQSIFCVFDIFLEKDLRILIKIPGGVRKIFLIDDKDALEANEDNLRTVFLSSLIRSWSENSPDTNSLYLEEITDSSSFDYMCESILFLLKSINLCNYL